MLAFQPTCYKRKLASPLAGLLFILTPLAASAQTPAASGELVERGVEDVDPLAQSLREIDPGMYSPARPSVRRYDPSDRPGDEGFYFSAPGVQAFFTRADYALDDNGNLLQTGGPGIVFNLSDPNPQLDQPVPETSIDPEDDPRLQLQPMSLQRLGGPSPANPESEMHEQAIERALHLRQAPTENDAEPTTEPAELSGRLALAARRYGFLAAAAGVDLAE